MPQQTNSTTENKECLPPHNDQLECMHPRSAGTFV